LPKHTHDIIARSQLEVSKHSKIHQLFSSQIVAEVNIFHFAWKSTQRRKAVKLTVGNYFHVV